MSAVTPPLMVCYWASETCYPGFQGPLLSPYPGTYLFDTSIVTSNKVESTSDFFRSSEDDYCPPDQVDCIQIKVLALLEELYGHLETKNHYLDD